MIYFPEGDSPTNWMQCFLQQFVNKEEKYLLSPADRRYGCLCNCDGERKRERELAAEIDAFEGIIGRSLIKEEFLYSEVSICFSNEVWQDSGKVLNPCGHRD